MIYHRSGMADRRYNAYPRAAAVAADLKEDDPFRGTFHGDSPSQ